MRASSSILTMCAPAAGMTRHNAERSRLRKVGRVLANGFWILSMPVTCTCAISIYGGLWIKGEIQDYFAWRDLWRKPPPRHRHKINPIKDQFSHSGLFAKLPYDLRLEIFKHLIEGRWNRRARATSTFCIASQASRSYNRYDLDDEDQTLTNLLRTCRHIYSEVSFLLYTSSTLKVEGLQDIANFTYLSRTISTNGFALIKDLTVDIQAWRSITYNARKLRKAHPSGFLGERFRYPYESVLDPHRNHPWQKLWAIVCTQMHGLEHLTLVLQQAWSFSVHQKKQTSGCVREPAGIRVNLLEESSLVPDMGEAWVKPLLSIRGLKDFHLELRATDPNEDLRRRFNVLEQKLRKELCSSMGAGPQIREQVHQEVAQSQSEV